MGFSDGEAFQTIYHLNAVIQIIFLIELVKQVFH